MRHDVFAEDIDHFVFDGVHLRCDEDFFSVNGDADSVFSRLCLCHGFCDCLCFSAEDRSHLAVVRDNRLVVNFFRLRVLDKDGVLLSGDCGVCL